MPTDLISIDIGSTYTKGALFNLSGDVLKVQETAVTATTTDDLRVGFDRVRKKLTPGAAELHFSSSAKGGLAIAAIGIVPDLTAKMAHEAAVSAGGKISALFSYKLTRDDLNRLHRLNPDVILFTGGLDGGNESYNRHNAEQLAKAALPCPIIYAGNRACRDEIQQILAKQELTITENVLPEIDQPDIEPARAAIRSIFLDRIVHGKGLTELVAATGVDPKPTPLAMLELVEQLYNRAVFGSPFCLVDLGGATTDFYSAGGGNAAAGVVRKGLPEPEIKRSVEGDLGMRVSAPAVLAAAPDEIADALKAAGLSQTAFESFIDQLTKAPETIPTNADKMLSDEILAAACLRLAARRHAGWREPIYTSDGRQWLQHGKDLRPVPVMIGTGGYLARLMNPALLCQTKQTGAAADGREHLLPQSPKWRIDRRHLFPLLANLAASYPAAVAQFAPDCLQKLEPVEASTTL